MLTYNNYYDTKECIGSLLNNTLTPRSIIIIDNGSHDDSIERLKSDLQNNPTIIFVQNPANFGFARGMNIGIKLALRQGGDFICLINNDTVLEKNCLKNLYLAITKAENIGIVGPRIFYWCEPERIWHGGGYYSFILSNVYIPEKNKIIKETANYQKKVTFLTGCVWMVRKEVFKKVGLLDEDFFFYSEDTDFCLRTIKKGFSLLYVPNAHVWHKIQSISKSRITPFFLYHMAKSKIILSRKHFCFLYSLYTVLLVIFVYTPFRIIQIMQGTRNFRHLIAWFRGIFAGIVQPICKKYTNDIE
ncbi:MAG: glycosyltransferase family 2 protein [Patescibacteria group bacterium]|nr:glycosyltransferase family 2 protein [Patescibacteria group bacterium]